MTIGVRLRRLPAFVFTALLMRTQSGQRDAMRTRFSAIVVLTIDSWARIIDGVNARELKDLQGSPELEARAGCP